jgi:hypothetical protein
VNILVYNLVNLPAPGLMSCKQGPSCIEFFLLHMAINSLSDVFNYEQRGSWRHKPPLSVWNLKNQNALQNFLLKYHLSQSTLLSMRTLSFCINGVADRNSLWMNHTDGDTDIGPHILTKLTHLKLFRRNWKSDILLTL